jgi:hypothetical protein
MTPATSFCSSSWHLTLGSYFRAALQGSADAVACLPVPWALACGVFPLSLLIDDGFQCLFLKEVLSKTNRMIPYLCIAFCDKSNQITKKVMESTSKEEKKAGTRACYKCAQWD